MSSVPEQIPMVVIPPAGSLNAAFPPTSDPAAPSSATPESKKFASKTSTRETKARKAAAKKRKRPGKMAVGKRNGARKQPARAAKGKAKGKVSQSKTDKKRSSVKSKTETKVYVELASTKTHSPGSHQGDELSPTTENMQLEEKKSPPKRPTPAYKLTPGISPFPKWKHPTPEECEEVNQILSYAHGEQIAPETIPQPSIEISGCGEVPCVLDALLRTLLSAATSSANSAVAYSSLVKKYGVLEEGIGRGGVNWEAVRQAPLRQVYETIKAGGLADTKSKNLKAILDIVYNQNKACRAALKFAQQTGDPDGLLSLTGSQLKEEENQETPEPNSLSLNHLHCLSTEAAMEALVKYPGIGVKTAACVLLFCMKRPCFAVDTHIFRITKWLGWVPADLATEVTAFSHLNTRIPDHLKYSLHQLFIRHGRECPRCRASTGESSAEWELGCPMEDLLTRTGKRKGGPEIFARRRRRRKASSAKTEQKKGSKDTTKKESVQKTSHTEAKHNTDPKPVEAEEGFSTTDIQEPTQSQPVGAEGLTTTDTQEPTAPEAHTSNEGNYGNIE